MVQEGSSQPLRPIRPRASAPDGPSSGPSLEEGKLKRASIACNECKRRRCSNGTPCTECHSHDRECVYNELADKRRKIAAKHTQDELQYYRGFLGQLLRAIRLGEKTNVDELVGVIRAGAGDDEILNATSRCLDQDQNPTKLDLPDELAMPGLGLDIADESLLKGWDMGGWSLSN